MAVVTANSSGYGDNGVTVLPVVVTVTMGVMAAVKVTATVAKAADHRTAPHYICPETPSFVARGIAALASAPNMMERTGNVFTSWGLSNGFGIVDVDGVPIGATCGRMGILQVTIGNDLAVARKSRDKVRCKDKKCRYRGVVSGKASARCKNAPVRVRCVLHAAGEPHKF